MTHFLHRPQMSTPSDLEDSRGFRTRLKPPNLTEKKRNLKGKPPGTTYQTSSDDSSPVKGSRNCAATCSAALFERVKAEHGHLDILVNNATALGPDPYAPPPFWEQEPDHLRAVYGWFTISVLRDCYAAHLLIAADGALVVNVSLLWRRPLPP